MGLSPRKTWILHFLGLMGGTTSCLFTADDVFRSDFSASHLDALCSQRARMSFLTIFINVSGDFSETAFRFPHRRHEIHEQVP
ncbi:hypothetical protein PGTUg99_020072 [Puccinia graminis f. sp. tritici]|uniref:Secreted protein n=1 Tax=Puccinia graminis f. sp. tritici TaxID=56615 RepID=A0A5B0PJ98_PUCGR|nr:hypothetical protein PGTUg99_020072 [Puccinia graminis f. sp. tritici]